MLEALYGAGSLSAPAYTRNIEKSAVWRGHIQLSVSPPYFPSEFGGVPTNRTSVYFLYISRIIWLPLKNSFPSATYLPFSEAAFSIFLLISESFLSYSFPVLSPI